MNTYKLFCFLVLCSTFTFAQVGVNIPTGSTVDASAAFEVWSGASPKGLLTPRMSTSLRTGIATPANGLLVFDTDLNAFYYNQGTSAAPVWVRINSGAAGRTNFRRIQSEADLIASSTLVGGSYQLYTNTFYEINGTIVLTKSIDLNNAYVAGVDANEDILSFTGGTVFKGSTGGSIKNITLKGAKAFEITGPGIATASSLLVQNTMITGMTTSVGSISGFGLYFGSIVQFVSNVDGITYSNIGNCLLDNQAWLSSNNGTFEKFTGNFGLVEKGSGFSTVDGSDLALDVSTDGLNVGTGTLEGTVFSGTTSATGGYIKGYAAAQTYTGYNFTNAWTVDSPGIPRESDGAASATLYKKNNATPVTTTVSATNPGTAIENGNEGTIATNLFRFQADNAGQLTYTGKKSRAFQATATLSFKQKNATGNTTTFYVFYFVKINGSTITPLPETETYIDANRDQVVALPVTGTIVLGNGDSVKLYVKRIEGNIAAIEVYSFNLSLK